MDSLRDKPEARIDYRTPSAGQRQTSVSEVFGGLFCAVIALACLLIGIAFGWYAVSVFPFSVGPSLMAGLCILGCVVMFNAASRLFRGRE